MSGPRPTPRGARDWRVWHTAYDDPGSALSRRLAVVQRRIGESFARLGPGPVRVVSLCAGDGRDVLEVLASPGALAAHVVLVERDPELAARARAAADAVPATVEVRVGDAGATETFADTVPVDLLLLCGIFGNVAEVDIRHTLGAVAAMVRPGGEVIWTRGRFGDDDLRPAVRRWVAEAGLEELAFDGDPEPFGVGVARRLADAPVRPLPAHLFTFVTGHAGGTRDAGPRAPTRER